jgi:hypothetical protein
VVSSNLEGIPMLFEDRPIVREWRSVLQIETKITQVAYFLGKTQNLLASLDGKGLSGLQQIVKKYQDDGLFTGVNLSNYGGISYYDILRDLARMNAGMKYFISVGTTKPLALYDYSALFQATFAPDALTQLQEYYAPIRVVKGLSPCNSTASKLKSSIKQSFSSNISAAKESRTTIANASKRLTDAFTKSAGFPSKREKEKSLAEQYFTEYELQQLRTIYGIDTTKITSKDALNLKNLLQVGANIKKSRNKSLKKAKSLVEDTDSLPQEGWGMVQGIFAGVKELAGQYNKVSEEIKRDRKVIPGWQVDSPQNSAF